MIDTNDALNGNITLGTNITGELTTGSSGEPTDVQINGISITSDGVANILTEGTYSSTNKLATMEDINNTLGDIETILGGI